MGAPRKHGDAQRGLIWDLHQAGYTSPEITAACERGTASCAPFSIPARTVRQIVTDMARERKFKPRYTLADLDDLDAIEQTPLAAARIVVREINRIESKAQPSASDFDKLSKALSLQPKIKTALRGGDLRKTPRLNDAAKKNETADAADDGAGPDRQGRARAGARWPRAGTLTRPRPRRANSSNPTHNGRPSHPSRRGTIWTRSSSSSSDGRPRRPRSETISRRDHRVAL